MKKNISFLWMLTLVVSSVLVAACSRSDDYQEPQPATSSMTVKVTLGTGEFDPLKVFDITAHVIDEQGKETAIPITDKDWTWSHRAGLPSTMSAYLTFEKKSTLPEGMTTFCYSIDADYTFFGELDNDKHGVFKWNGKIDNATNWMLTLPTSTTSSSTSEAASRALPLPLLPKETPWLSSRTIFSKKNYQDK